MVSATRHVETAAAPVDAPSIAGSWIIPLENPSAKGRKHSDSLSSSMDQKSRHRFFVLMEIRALTRALTRMGNGCLVILTGLALD